MRIPLAKADYSRSVAETPAIPLVNRYFESDPTNQKDQVGLLVRPGLKKWLTVGSGNIREGGIYSCPGAFDEALFVVSGTELWRVDQDETKTLIGTVTGTEAVSMTATDFPHQLFVANGAGLKVYTDNALATGTLTSSGAISNGEQVRIGSVYYQWTSGSVDTGTPLGTSGAPWLVRLGSTAADSIALLADAIGATAEAGTDYSTALVANTEAAVNSITSTTLIIRAIAEGTAGNSVATTETGANIAWGGATLSGGGGTSFASVTVPDNDGIISVGYIASFVICVVAQGFDKNGRFYWIEPLESTIEPLNYAAAERSPDPVHEVVVVGDLFWLPGTSTNEIWYPSGQEAAPFLRQQGRLYDKGTWEGTVIRIMDEVLTIDAHGNVWRIGAEPQIVSTPGIAQRFREAINAQREG